MDIYDHDTPEAVIEVAELRCTFWVTEDNYRTVLNALVDDESEYDIGAVTIQLNPEDRDELMDSIREKFKTAKKKTQSKRKK